MALSLPAFDKGTLKALRHGDSGALERIFRAVYAQLVEEGVKQLGDATLGPRLARDAILAIWDERVGFEEVEELHEGLRRAIHGEVVREQRKRAAPHREPQGKPSAQSARPAPRSVDEAWAQIAAELSAPKADPHRAGAHPGDAKAHAVASKIAATGGRSRAGPVVGGILMVAVVAGGLWWLQRRGEETTVERSFSSPQAKFLTAGPGQRGSMTLSDSTKITLGADSRVTVPPVFGELGRVVKLDGTAIFNVAVTTPTPFDVRAGNATILATGTEFSVRAFPDEKTVTVRVEVGQVEVRSPTDSRTLATGGAVEVAQDGAMTEPAADALAHAFEWTVGKFSITNRPLREAVPALRRWYGVTMAVPDSELLDRPVTMSLPLDKTKEAVAALEKSANVKFVYEKNKPVLRDAGRKGKQ